MFGQLCWRTLDNIFITPGCLAGGSGANLICILVCVGKNFTKQLWDMVWCPLWFTLPQNKCVYNAIPHT